MSKDELIAELKELHSALSALERGEVPETVESAEETPAVSRKKAFGKDKIYCMICGKGFKTLARHLKTAHEMTAAEYRKQFDIPRSQSLAAKNYSESRRQMAVDRGLADNLAKARAARKNK
jgi:predicted transcriptional regulator